MSRSLAGEIVEIVVEAGWWLVARGVSYGARAVAAQSLRLLPPPRSRRAALQQGIAVGLLCVLAAGLLAAPLGGGALVLGAVLGGAFGVAAGWAVVDAGRGRAAARNGGVVLGEREGTMGVRRLHVIPRAVRVRHVAVYGPTGSGKSTMLKRLVHQDAAAPSHPGLLCLDIKDDLVLEIAAQLPPARVAGTLLFDAADTAFPPAFNPLAGVPPAGRTLAAAELVSAFKRLYAEAWGPRLEHVLRAAALTLLETPNATLLDVVRLLTDEDYRAWAVRHVTNFSVRSFWEREWRGIVGNRGSLANVESILNKLSVLAYPEVRNILGQARRGLDLRQAMDRGQIVLAHLPQGVLGEDAANFLAALLVGKVQLAAQSRVALPSAQRRTFYVIADEFQNYETSAFDKLITEGRSMGVGLVAACQFPEQLPPHLRLSLERNCGYALTCRLVQGRHVVVVQTLQEPESPDATVVVDALPPLRSAGDGQLNAIRSRSRTLLARPRAEVEAEIAGRMADGWRASGEASTAAGSNDTQRQQHQRQGGGQRKGRSARREEGSDAQFFEDE